MFEPKAIRFVIAGLLGVVGCGGGEAGWIETMKSVADRVRGAERLVVSIEGAGAGDGSLRDGSYELTDAAAIGAVAGMLDRSVPMRCHEGMGVDIGEPVASVSVFEKSSDAAPAFRFEVSYFGYLAVYPLDEDRTVCLPSKETDLSDLFRRLVERDFGDGEGEAPASTPSRDRDE